MNTRETKPVLIVGAGPTGLAAAMELSRFGVPVRLIEKEREPATTSRAIGVQARTLELFEQRGLADEFVRIGNKGVAGSFYGGGKCVFRLDFSHIDSKYGYILFISQAETERILREQIARRGVTVEWGVEMIAFAQLESASDAGHASSVTATLRHRNGSAQDGSLEEFEASYLISAEGAHSILRRSLGIEFQGKSLNEDYVLGDLLVESDLQESEFHIFSSELGFVALFPLNDRRFRMIASNPLSRPSKETALAIDELQKIYDMRSHIPAQFRDITWSSWFRINSRMIHQLQNQRVFLGGDSAQIHSPAGGQGMNTGIQDMIDLSWKLAMVMQGKASQELLATYGEDRIPVIRNVLSRTERLTDVAGSENAIFRAAFNRIAPFIVGTDFVQEQGTAQVSQIALNYRDSPLSETYAHQGSLRAGDRIPDISVRTAGQNGVSGQSSVRLFTLIDPSKFTLLFVNVSDPAPLIREMQKQLANWQDWINSYPVLPNDSDQDERRRFTLNFGHSPTLVFVRPDAYIGFVSSADSLTRLAGYMRKWFPSEGSGERAKSAKTL